LSKLLGRKITHVKLFKEDRVKSMLKIGAAEFYAQAFTAIELQAAGREPQRSDGSVERVTGQKPQHFEDWAEENKAVW
jgi:hypothetical protein